MILYYSHESRESTVVFLDLMRPSILYESHESPLVCQSLMSPLESLLVFISINIHMSPKKSPRVSWVSIRLAETDESPVVVLILLSPQESLWNSWVSSSLFESHESPEVSLSLVSPYYL